MEQAGETRRVNELSIATRNQPNFRDHPAASDSNRGGIIPIQTGKGRGMKAKEREREREREREGATRETRARESIGNNTVVKVRENKSDSG